jgi:hypothetical protein
MNTCNRCWIRSNLLILAILVVLSAVALAGCQLPWFTQWYFENHRFDPVRFQGDYAFDRVFVIPPCSAGYYYYLHEAAATYDEATRLDIYIDNQGSTLVPSDTVTYRPIINIGMIQVIVNSETADTCGQAITNMFQVQVQNDSTEAIDVLYHDQKLGTSQPGTTSIFGPIKSIVSDNGVSFSYHGQGIPRRTQPWVQNWKIGEIPTFKYVFT